MTGKVKTFPLGGVHPEENKLSANAPIEMIPVPKQAFIPWAKTLEHLQNPL